MERTWRPDWPCPVPRVLGGLRRGAGDPTYLTDAHRTVWKTFGTPEGDDEAPAPADSPRTRKAA